MQVKKIWTTLDWTKKVQRLDSEGHDNAIHVSGIRSSHLFPFLSMILSSHISKCINMIEHNVIRDLVNHHDGKEFLSQGQQMDL